MNPRVHLRRAAAVLVCLVAGGAIARRPPPAPSGELLLDLADPIVTIEVAGVPLRLRVGLDERNVVELNRASLARLPLAFEPGPTDSIGRTDAKSVVAVTSFVMNAATVAVTFASHGTCCAGVDGAISPALLPYARVRFVRAAARPIGTTRAFALTQGGEYGLEVREPVGRATLRLKFALDKQETLATAAAGAVLAAAHGGRFDGGYSPAEVAFGVARPTRMIAFARPATLAGFRFDRLRTRTADFGGHNRLPTDPTAANEIVVSRKVSPQHGWASVRIGRDRLDRCAEIVYRAAPPSLTLRCEFDEPSR